MKKILILALMCAPFLSFSQNKTPDATKSPAEGKAPAVAKTYTPENIYGELVVFENNGRTSLRLDFGRDVITNLTDKEQIAQLETLRETSFANVPDAINYLAANGFRLINSYNFIVGGREETHFLFEKRLLRTPGTGDVGGMQRPPSNPLPRDPAARPGNTTQPGGKTDTKTKDKK